MVQGEEPVEPVSWIIHTVFPNTCVDNPPVSASMSNCRQYCAINNVYGMCIVQFGYLNYLMCYEHEFFLKSNQDIYFHVVY